jgi:transcription initiation factor TFIIIB Brf1 subunit/transcription initiation factor TFIIB
MQAKQFLEDFGRKMKMEPAELAKIHMAFDSAVEQGFAKRHDTYALACGCLYLFCKRYGKVITLTQIAMQAPATHEEILAAYDELKPALQF